MAVPRDQAGVRRQVAAGYDHMADRYTQARSPVLPPLLEAFAEGLDDGAAALDLGCGAGVPISAWLARRFAVTGIDASARQIALARERVPLADFRQADMTVARFPTARFALIVAAYSIIHVPREEHSSLIHRIASWLAPGGGFLASWALDAWEGEEQIAHGLDAEPSQPCLLGRANARHGRHVRLKQIFILGARLARRLSGARALRGKDGRLRQRLRERPRLIWRG